MAKKTPEKDARYKRELEKTELTYRGFPLSKPRLSEGISHVFQCNWCGSIHPTEEAALKCLRSTEPHPFEPGDIVVMSSSLREGEDEYCPFGWYDGDERWIFKKGRGLHGGPGAFAFYYVVTANIYRINGNFLLLENAHDAVFCVATKAMQWCGYSHGWTHQDTHTNFTKLEDPPKFIVKSSKDLIGQISDRLL